MRTLTKVGVALATVALSVGLLGSPASARVDTSWGGCCGIVKSGTSR